MDLAMNNIRLTFDASEYLALESLALKYGTDLGSILRIGGQLVLEADRRGMLRMRDAAATLRAINDGGKPS